MNIYNLQISFGLEVPDKISLNIYFSGCANNKKCDRSLCQNKDLHSFESGTNYVFWLERIHSILKEELVECVCLLGGEPLDQDIQSVKTLVKEIDIPIYAYTGYDYLENCEKIDSFINTLDIKNIFVGHYSSTSSNQYWLKG